MISRFILGRRLATCPGKIVLRFFAGLFITGLMFNSLIDSVTAQVFYKNPVIAGDHPDPSIIRVGKDFWATCTSSEWGPQFPLFRSTDLVNWELTGAVFAHRPDWAVGNFWAPEISEYQGR